MARKRRLQSDSEDEQEGDQEIPEESPQAKKKRVSSAKDADEDETMEDNFNCSQFPDFTVTTSEAEVGIIEKITLVNFMCHTMLEVPLGANVNFIIGKWKW